MKLVEVAETNTLLLLEGAALKKHHIHFERVRPRILRSGNSCKRRNRVPFVFQDSKHLIFLDAIFQ